MMHLWEKKKKSIVSARVIIQLDVAFSNCKNIYAKNPPLNSEVLRLYTKLGSRQYFYNFYKLVLMKIQSDRF